MKVWVVTYSGACSDVAEVFSTEARARKAYEDLKNTELDENINCYPGGRTVWHVYMYDVEVDAHILEDGSHMKWEDEVA